MINKGAIMKHTMVQKLKIKLDQDWSGAAESGRGTKTQKGECFIRKYYKLQPKMDSESNTQVFCLRMDSINNMLFIYI